MIKLQSSSFFRLLPRTCLLVAGCLLAQVQSAAAVLTPDVDVIAGRKIELLSIKQPASSVSIVFENGSRATLDSWDKVIDGLGADASIFAYNRPGYGKSQEAVSARDGMTIVEELRQDLKFKGFKPPYILVGHSLGGLYMQLFARKYPDEVNGIVLVDALYPRLVKKPDEFPLLTRGAKRLFFSSTVNQEIDLIYQTGEQVLALASIDDKPMIRLMNRPTGATAVPVDFGAFNTDAETMALVRGLYPKSKKVFVDSSHQMQTETPLAVINAIKEVMSSPTRQR